MKSVNRHLSPRNSVVGTFLIKDDQLYGHNTVPKRKAALLIRCIRILKNLRSEYNRTNMKHISVRYRISALRVISETVSSALKVYRLFVNCRINFGSFIFFFVTGKNSSKPETLPRDALTLFVCTTNARRFNISDFTSF